MRAGKRTRHRAQRGPLHAANRVEQRSAGLGSRLLGIPSSLVLLRAGPWSRMLVRATRSSFAHRSAALDADSALRNRHMTHHRRDDLLGGDAVGIGGEVRQDAVPEHGLGDAPHIIGRDGRAAREERMRFRA